MKRLTHYSQNFLRSPETVIALFARNTLKPTSVVYDLGAGSGVITSVLAKKVKEVVAVEFEPRIAKTLQENMKKYPNVTVKVADATKIPLPKTPYTIVANIPFHLSSPIVRRFFNSDTSPQAAYLIVQKQFGKKLESTNAAQFTSQLGMLLGAEYSIKVIKNLRKTDFIPQPAVDTVWIAFTKRPTPLINKNRLAAYARYTEECFSDPKKLARLPLHVIGMEKGGSPSRLTIDQWVLLFHSQKIY